MVAEPGAGSGDGRAAPFDAVRFRQVLGHFCTGVTVLTAVDGAGPVGFTVQSFTSVSLEPPLVSVCPARRSGSWPRMRAAGAFCANVLAEDQETVGRAFAAPDQDRFAGVGWEPSAVTGSPVLHGALAWVDCRLHAEHDGGDHLIVVATVVDLSVGAAGDTGGPLLFYRGGYGRFRP